MLSTILFLLDNEDIRKRIEESSVLFMSELLNDTVNLKKSLAVYLSNLDFSQDQHQHQTKTESKTKIETDFIGLVN